MSKQNLENEPSPEEIKGAEDRMTEEDKELTAEREKRAEINEHNRVFLEQGVSEDGMYFDFLMQQVELNICPDRETEKIIANIKSGTETAREFSEKQKDFFLSYIEATFKPFLANMPIALATYASNPELRDNISKIISGEAANITEATDDDPTKSNNLCIAYGQAIMALDKEIGDDPETIRQLQDMTRKEYLDWLKDKGFYDDKIDAEDIPERQKNWQDMLHKGLSVLQDKFGDVTKYFEIWIQQNSHNISARSLTRGKNLGKNQGVEIELKAACQYGQGGAVLEVFTGEWRQEEPNKPYKFVSTGGSSALGGQTKPASNPSYEQFAQEVDEKIVPLLENI